MLRIVTDSAADNPPDWEETYAFNIIPINIHFGEKTYLDGVDLSDEQFYALARKGGMIPKTSQPSPHQFKAFYRSIAQTGDTILSIHVTSKLSGTFASAVMAARELAGEFNILPFDSAAGSAAQGFMCKEARLLERAGAPLKAILKRLEYIRQHVSVILTLDTLEYARMSGRVRALQAALASVLNIKPIINLQDGILDVAGRVRTRRRALDHLLNTLEGRLGRIPINAAVVHSLDPETAHLLIDRLRERFDCCELITTNLSIAVAANLGPGTVGVVAYPVGDDPGG